MIITIQQLQTALADAPADPGPDAGVVAGWEKDEIVVCAHCAGRIFARGLDLFSDFDTIWAPADVACQIH